MRVNVANLKLETQILNGLISDYEKNYQNIYNVFNDLTNYWSDGNSKIFLNNINEKKKIRETYHELISVYNVYKYIIENYEVLGDNIEFNLDYKNNVLDNFNNCLNALEKINTKINNVDISFCQSKENFYNAKQLIKESNGNSKNIKDKIKNSIAIIEEIERKVRKKADNIDIKFLKEE